MNNIIFIIMDSCRYDTFVAAKKNAIDLFTATNNTAVEKRYSYASWTSPSHYVMLMGLMPHRSPSKVFASDVYKTEFANWITRIGKDGLSFKNFIPEFSLPKVLRMLGYQTLAMVSMPVLNPMTPLNNNFDNYTLMDNHNDFPGMVDRMIFKNERPSFYFCNLGETHYPYMLSGENLPHISGVHGVFKQMDDFMLQGGPHQTKQDGATFFQPDEMQRLFNQQIRCVEHLDRQFHRLFLKAPAGTHVIITADHGELFGEDDYFGHGPIAHEKCFEVPFLEGKISAELQSQLTTLS